MSSYHWGGFSESAKKPRRVSRPKPLDGGTSDCALFAAGGSGGASAALLHGADACADPDAGQRPVTQQQEEQQGKGHALRGILPSQAGEKLHWDAKIAKARAQQQYQRQQDRPSGPDPLAAPFQQADQGSDADGGDEEDGGKAHGCAQRLQKLGRQPRRKGDDGGGETGDVKFKGSPAVLFHKGHLHCHGVLRDTLLYYKT